MTQYLKIHNRRAIIMRNGWTPRQGDTAFIYPGRGDANMKQWLVSFEDEVRQDGRPAPFFMLLLAHPEDGPLDVAPDAIRLARDHGFDTSRATGFKLYPLPEGDEIDLSGLRFFVGG